MKRFIARIAYRFGSNNNMWMIFIWSLTFVHLLFNLIVFGFGPAIFFPGPSKEIEEINNLYLYGFSGKKSDFISGFSTHIYSLRWYLLVVLFILALVAKIRAWRKSLSWTIWSLFFILVLFSFGYVILAWLRFLSWTLWFLFVIASLLALAFLWDEVSRAWGFAIEIARERREGKIKGPSAPVVTTSQSAGQAAPQTAPLVQPGGMPLRSGSPLVRGFIIWEAFQFIFDFLAGLSLYRR